MEKKTSLREQRGCPVTKDKKRLKVKEKLTIQRKREREKDRVEDRKREHKASRSMSGNQKPGRETMASPQRVYSDAAWINSFNAALYIYRKVPLIE